MEGLEQKVTDKSRVGVFSLGSWCVVEDWSRFERGKDCTRGLITFVARKKVVFYGACLT